MLSLAREERKKAMYKCSFMEWTKKLHLFRCSGQQERSWSVITRGGKRQERRGALAGGDADGAMLPVR